MTPLRALPRRFVALGCGVALVVGLAACGSDSKATTSSASTGAASGGGVAIKDFTFSPDALTVKAGTAINIVNNDSQPHTFTSDTSGVFDSGSIQPGGSPDKPVSITAPGEYAYHCSFHPFMHGKLIVQ